MNIKIKFKLGYDLYSRIFNNLITFFFLSLYIIKNILYLFTLYI